MTFFQYLTISVFVLFMGIMAFATITAYARQSGATGQSMAQIQMLRSDSREKRI